MLKQESDRDVLEALMEFSTTVVGALWEWLGSRPPGEQQPILLILGVIAVYLLGEALLYGRSTSTCGARTKTGGHCRREVSPGGKTCGIHSRMWLALNLVGVLLLLAVMLHVVRLF